MNSFGALRNGHAAWLERITVSGIAGGYRGFESDAVEKLLYLNGHSGSYWTGTRLVPGAPEPDVSAWLHD